MSDYKSIVVHVDDSKRLDSVLAVATFLTAAHGARLRAVRAVEPIYMGAYMGAEAAMTAAGLQIEAEEQNLQAAEHRVREAQTNSGLAIEFSCPGGDPVAALCEPSHTADLLVVGKPSNDALEGPSTKLVSRLLIAAGCPVLLVPSATEPGICGSRVLVAWSQTRESARALRDALPLLQQASVVEVLRIGSTEPGAAEPLSDVVAYLRLHGVSAKCFVQSPVHSSFSERMLTPNVVDTSVTELLLSYAADTNSNLIVMGGYGHSRAYELVMGGVTRSMLQSMSVPVLMSH